MQRFWRYLRTLIVLSLGLGVAALLAVIFWLPPNDPDSIALVRERTARLAAYHVRKPIPGAQSNLAPLDQRLSQGGFTLGAPVLLRVYKLSFELEVWLKRDSGYALFTTYPICYFSGQLGPKLRMGDWQSPEGFYKIEPALLNPFTAHHRAFNIGFPNAFDRALGRTGTMLEIHGGCSSVGCYAVTNPAIDDIYKLITAAFASGQPSFQVQALPFRMTAEAMANHANHPQSAFWSELKTIADSFDDTHQAPDVAVCDGHYRLARTTGQRTTEPGCRKL